MKTGWIEITCNSQSVENNTSTITVAGKIETTGESFRGDHRTGTYDVYQGGKLIKSGTFTHGAPANSTTTLFSVDIIVDHASDGTSGVITASYNYSDGWCSGSGSLTLATIPRASYFSGVTSGPTIGNTMQVYIGAYSSSFTHNVYYKLGNSSWYTALSGVKGGSSALSFTLDMALCSQLTSATSGTLTLLLRTYSGSTQIGSDVYATVTAYVPSSVAPTCALTVTDYMGYASKYGKPIKGLSMLKVDISAGTSYGSPIASYSASANGTAYYSASFVTGVLKSSGSNTINATVKDKRGRTGSDSETINVYDYSAPTISTLNVLRCNSDGTEYDQGEYVKVTFACKVTSLDFQNSVTTEIKFKKTTESDYISEYESEDVDFRYRADEEAIFTGADNESVLIFKADTESSYDILVTVQDDFKTSQKSTVVSTAYTLLDWHDSGKALSIGKVCEVEEGLELGTHQYINDGYDIKAHYGASNQYDLISKVDELSTNLNTVTANLGQIGDYARITLADNYAIASQNVYEKLPMSNTLVNYGNTFKCNSDGSITVLRDCVVMVIGQPYFGVGFQDNDWLCSAIYISDSPVGRAGATVHHTAPYLTLTANYIGQRNANEWIDLRVLNETGARGQVSISNNSCYLLVVALS